MPCSSPWALTRHLTLGIQGEELEGVRGGAEFFAAAELGGVPPVGQRVAVIRRRKRGIDVARTCRRMGAQVCILYRRERKDMPAYEEEIEDALAEGIDLKVLPRPRNPF